MILGAFGDSFLFGSDLHDIQNSDCYIWHIHSNLTYPALLAKELKFSYYCTALPAQGNKVIADDIIRAVVYNRNKMFYVINWSWIDRHEYMSDARVGSAHGWNSTLPGDNNKTSKLFYKNFYNDLDAKLSNLMYINSALDALLTNNCKFVMTYMDHLLFDQKFNSSVSIEYLQNKIKPYMKNFDEMNFLDWSKKNNFAISDNWHPLEDAHRASAEYWLPKVRTLLNSSAKEEKPNASK